MVEYTIINKNNKNYLYFNKNVMPQYIIEMQVENNITNILTAYKDVEFSLLYDITNLKSLKKFFVEDGATLSQINIFMESVYVLRKSINEYLIDEKYIIYDENLIFTNTKFNKIYFCIYFMEDNNSDNLTKLFKYIVGNYFFINGFKEIRIREEILKYLKTNAYKYSDIKNIIRNIDNINMTKEIESPKKFEFSFMNFLINRNEKKSKQNNTCELKNIEGGNCLTNISDVTTKIFIEQEEFVISRNTLTKLYDINNKKIGRSHARIYLENDKIVVFDLGSKNGTYINGERIDKRTPFSVEKGDIVSFADEEFIVC